MVWARRAQQAARAWVPGLFHPAQAASRWGSVRHWPLGAMGETAKR